jgi:hypothetical protein
MLQFLFFFVLIQVVLEDQFVEDEGNICIISVDGTDFKINICKPLNTMWYSYKHNGPGLRYEVALCINTGMLCWVRGPSPPGLFPDITIFCTALMQELDPHERVEAGGGYGGEDTEFLKTPANFFHPADKKPMQRRVCTRHKTINKRLNQFGCLKQVFHHKVQKH